MKQLTPKHIDACYWMANQYFNASVKQLTEMYDNINCFSIKEALRIIKWNYLCIHKGNCCLHDTANGKCYRCIHTAVKTEPQLGSHPCHTKTLCDICETDNIKDMVDAMHKRGVYLYQLLNQYESEDDNEMDCTTQTECIHQF